MVDPSWVWFPIAVWLLMLAARAAGFDPTKPGLLSRLFSSQPVRGAMVMSLLAVLDAAAIIGSIQWLLLDCFRWSRKAPVEAGNGA